MKKIFGRFVDVEIWKDFYDELWRISVNLFGREVARFKLVPYEYRSLSGVQSSSKLERLSNGEK